MPLMGACGKGTLETFHQRKCQITSEGRFVWMHHKKRMNTTCGKPHQLKSLWGIQSGLGLSPRGSNLERPLTAFQVLMGEKDSEAAFKANRPTGWGCVQDLDPASTQHYLMQTHTGGQQAALDLREAGSTTPTSFLPSWLTLHLYKQQQMKSNIWWHRQFYFWRNSRCGVVMQLWKTLKLVFFGQIQCDVTTRLIPASWSHFILMASQKCFLRPACVFIPASEEEGGVFFCCSKLMLHNHRQQVIPSDRPNAWRRINQPRESNQNYNLRHRFPIRTGWMCLDEIIGKTQNNIHWIQNVPPLIYRNVSTWVGVQSGGLRLTGSRKHWEISVRRDTHWAIKSSLFSA